MQAWENSSRKEKFRKNLNNPSFSSTLLDEIYRSIDKYDGANQRVMKKYSNRNGVREKICNPIEDEEMATLRRARLIEKWMEEKVNEKNFIRRPPLLPDIEKDPLQYDDPLFSSSTSTSSESSSGGLSSSSSDTEFFEAAKKTRKSCFASPWPKPIRTKVSSRQAPLPHHENQSQRKIQIETEDSIKSRSRDLRIYANLKNAKQPISPGGRLSSFINSLFTNGGSKKGNKCNNSSYKTGDEGAKMERKSQSTCSSATSFSRSCLSKTPPSSRGKFHREGAKKTVSFYPVSVIVDEEYRPCGHRYIDDTGPRAPLSEEMNSETRNNRKVEGFKMDGLKVYQNHKDDFVVERSNGEDEDDAASDCSSDLFEIDPLVLFGSHRFCEELPVYETTHLDKNLAIASGLIR